MQLIRFSLFPAPESYFMQAEARERYFGGDQAQTLYNAGVQAAFAFYGFDATTLCCSGRRL